MAWQFGASFSTEGRPFLFAPSEGTGIERTLPVTTDRLQELLQMPELELIALAVDRGVYVLGMRPEQMASAILSTELDADLRREEAEV
jgi:hypothetical protein